MGTTLLRNERNETLYSLELRPRIPHIIYHKIWGEREENGRGQLNSTQNVENSENHKCARTNNQQTSHAQKYAATPNIIYFKEV